MERLFEILKAYDAQAIAFMISIILFLIKGWLDPKVKIIWGKANGSFHLLPNENSGNSNTAIYTEKFFVKNSGKKPSSQIELVFNSKPNQVSIFPEQSVITKDINNGKYAMEVPYIAPKGMVIIDTVCLNGKDGKLNQVNCKDVVSKQVQFIVNQKYSKWFNLSIVGLTFIGFAAVIYSLLRLAGV